MLSAVTDQAYNYVNGNDIGAGWADIDSVRHWLVLCRMLGYAGFLKLLDTTAFKSL